MARTSRIGLRARLLLTSTLVLGLGLGLTGWVLDRSFTASVVAGAEEQLKLLIYSLLGAAEEDGTSLRFPPSPLEPRLEQPESGLYATVSDADGTVIWRSPFAAVRQRRVTATRDDAVRSASWCPAAFGFAKPTATSRCSIGSSGKPNGDQVFTFRVIADQAPFRSAIASFRRTLMLGLAGGGGRADGRAGACDRVGDCVRSR